MANVDHLKILKQGVVAWNQWRSANFLVLSDLSQVNLSGENLRGADLDSADLSRADFIEADLSLARMQGANLKLADLSGADLTRADLENADLSRADLRQAILTEANLTGAHLRGANLVEADLRGTNLSRAWVAEADLTRARVSNTVFGDIDLRGAWGIDSLRHEGPNIVGIDTVYRSHGKIPQVFLRGAGVPDSFIDYMPSLVSPSIDFYSCFITYSSKDQDFANRLYADLQRNRVRCWFAPEDLKIGDKLRPSFDHAIRLYDKLLVILSAHSVTSQWVEKEVETAFEKERRQNRIVLFPIRLDDAVMETHGA